MADAIGFSGIMEDTTNTTNPQRADNTPGVLTNPTVRSTARRLNLNILAEYNNGFHFSCDLKTSFPDIELPTWRFLKWHCPRMAGRMLAEFKRVNGFIPYENGFVYLIHGVGTNYYKIGKSIHPDKRVLQISPKMPFKAEIVQVWRSLFMSDAERIMHEEYEAYRTNGEWFEFDKETLARILMNDRLGGEIKYAYSSRWSKVLWGDNERADRQEHFLFDLKLIELNDTHCLNELSPLSLLVTQYYFDEIEREFPFRAIPKSLMEQVWRQWEEDGSICAPTFDSEDQNIDSDWLEGIS
jgi:hypothetical protein